jgi:soluble lytic murein transglycosylase-like protein
MGALKAGLLGPALALVWAAPAAAGPVDRWAAQIAEASSKFGIPQDWIRRVMSIESGGETSLGGQPIVSRAGAMGLMQLMPATWREMRGLLGLGADPNDPRDNILAGSLYLRRMYDRFGYPGLFAAYNAGPGRYSEFLSAARPLPAETRTYLANAKRTVPYAAGAVPRHELTLVAAATEARRRQTRVGAASAGRLFVPLSGAAGR